MPVILAICRWCNPWRTLFYLGILVFLIVFQCEHISLENNQEHQNICIILLAAYPLVSSFRYYVNVSSFVQDSGLHTRQASFFMLVHNLWVLILRWKFPCICKIKKKSLYEQLPCLPLSIFRCQLCI